ncbi:MAG: Chemotaxis response regulator protein-glutamate methylesterase [candidate division CPR2 bacterium GW2011_GWC1_39_9]|uniref:Protein-glutamate methylesterase/protein-glutamine glutaminase n=1 Tax=candidate division CPR2 bacterium GW2011_GWC2_39_10 TaxID=1618345 RepID=A0A0G0PBE0_UNCC2|nr:MAG: Chemotaxis response regulator protein-glutamate methylesterase [candidate division CPR2 bacterium GW2011_GWC2_39_10]KKR36216.1 MAG: Chemotaxis response regulator protein-glutamate methylesterase [candidate division CPR2 bacterium GW2011_GWC1_39_9]
MSDKLNVFIIDDNVMVRYALRQILSQESDIIVVGDSSDHSKLEAEIKRSGADVLICDIPLPRETGTKRLKQVNSKRLPTIVFTRSDDAMVKDLVPLLEAGAVAFVLKPKKDEDIDSVRAELVHEVRAQSKNKIKQSKTSFSASSFLDPLRVVAIGSSTGGPEALSNIIGQFPKDFPAGIVIVQHMPKDFTTRFAERLNHLAQITVKEAQNGDVVKSGLALVAPGGFHMVFNIEHQGRRQFAQVKLNTDPPQWKLRPTVDKMMSSIAPIYGSNIIGVILTGMGDDGVVGMKAIKNAGGRTLVQDESTSVVYGMAQEVVKNNLADEVLPLTKIVPRILEMLKVKL